VEPDRKTILITGGFGSTGRRITPEPVEGGATVIGCDRGFTTSEGPGLITEQGEHVDVPRRTRVLQAQGVAWFPGPRVRAGMPVRNLPNGTGGVLPVSSRVGSSDDP
jgi:hypothetical protein